MSLSAVLVVAAVLVVLVATLRRHRPSAGADGDAAVLEQLRAAGSDLAKPHDVEFFFYFPTQAAAQHVADKLNRLAFKTQVGPAVSGSSQPWHVVAVRRMLPELAEIQRLRVAFTALARSENGEFDGWGTPIVR